MKANFLLRILCIFLITLNSFGQSSKKDEGIKLGFKGGLNISNFLSSDIEDQSYRTSFHVGFLSEIMLSEKVSFQPELLYTTQGASYETALADYKNELGYIVIPAMLQIHLSKSITLDMGPQVGFLLNEKNNFDVQKSNTFDASANAGLGLKITNSIFAQARYCVGLTELKPNSEIKNNVVQLSLGILF